MLRVDLQSAKPGMKLALPVFNPKAASRILLRRDCELTTQMIARLKEHGLRWVWVRYPSLTFLEKFISSETLSRQGQVVGHITETFERLQQSSSAKLPYDTYTASIGTLIEHLMSNPSAAMFLGDLDHAGDDLMRHSSAVTYLSVLMGLKLEAYMVRERPHVAPARAKEIRNLGLGAMLHDVGVVELPGDIRQQYERSGDEGDPQWREHPALGYRMMRGRIDASAAAVVLHHHQRVDGSGYAGADFPVQSGHSIHVYARIVAVADELDRLRRPPGAPERPTVAALGMLLDLDLRSTLDEQALAALLAVVPPYPPGSMVTLSDGREAVCIDHHSDQPCRPMVQIIDPSCLDSEDAPPGETLDLRAAPPQLHVAQAEGHYVADLNFDPPGELTPQRGLAAAWG